jgi:acetylornithine deacetylase/succinyl-diaminopimelate desuccinylase-like protein
MIVMFNFIFYTSLSLYAIERFVDSNMNALVFDLQTLIRHPSISAKNHGLLECARVVSSLMEKAGINSELLYIENSKHIAPIVYGEVRSRSNPQSKTLLFYNHYDVQPIEPYELWDIDPFGGSIKDNKIFGRGSSDDKGELITRIKAVEYFLKKNGDVPCNIKFVVEGEEEIGSPHIEKYLSQFYEKFSCDAIIWESGYVDSKDRPIISLGIKGILYVEMKSIGPSVDVHSGLAVLVRNPAWRIIKAINTLWDDTGGKILVKDWYKEARELTPTELSLIATNRPHDFDENNFKIKYKIDRLATNATGPQIHLALMQMPTFNISGLNSGHIGEGPKTIVPSLARAKIDFRLIPDMEYQKQFVRLKNHLHERGFDDIKLDFIYGVPASKSPIDQYFIMQVKQSAKYYFDVSPLVYVSSWGSGPMEQFVRVFRVPCVSIGCTHIFSNIHSPNEYARIDLLNKATKWIGNIIKRFADSNNKLRYRSNVISPENISELGIWNNF